MYLKIKLLKEVPKISQFTSHQHERQQRYECLQINLQFKIQNFNYT